ncbi:transcription factor TFIIIB component B'' homolog isoform X5 [Chionomys nivalis]|uniref:transcription factor TFIIIB component B'' homolog isoform X5 n=1 Tax=Chionomys nivalis TaxID=269649 RepID=UPI0025969521|nr:transcription factor TFIIIB component B'' homolog isoform X5 [Chionomys nivalis]
MFRRARLSVKPNVRPGGGSRNSAAPNPQRGPEAPRPPEPATESAPKPAEPTDVPAPAVASGGAEPQEKAPRSSDAKTGDENNVEESSKPSSTVSQRRKRVPSTSSLAKPTVSVPSQCQPLSAVNHDAPQPSPAPAKEKPPCSDRYRIYKARKLREMLKEELRKEKKQWKNKFATNESQRPPDRSKMTMRDFIYYLPDNNPMTSSVEQEKKTEKSLAPTPARDRQDNQSTHDADDNGDVEEKADDGPLLVPRVKVAEDGSIILDEESLTVEVLRTKGPCVVEENDPIFERGSTTTYSSFRKNYYSKPWSNKETDMFFLAISMVGTDFSMIGQLFPHRARIEIKNKFKREEKTNGWRIDKAFQEKRPFDFDFFAHLLQKVLAEEEKRKKSTKCQSSKEKSSKPRKNVKAKKVTSEEVNDDPDESVNSNSSDPERSQKDAQTLAEEEPPTSSGQDLEQTMLEQDQNQEKRRRRKKQNEANKQEAANLVGNVLVQSSSPEAEIHKNTSPEENEGSEEQTPSFPQHADDIAESFSPSSETVELRTGSSPSTCNQQDIMPLTSESSESSAADLPLSEVAGAASCEVNNAGTEERSVDLENRPLLIKQKMLNQNPEVDCRDLNLICPGQLGRSQLFLKIHKMKGAKSHLQKLQLKSLSEKSCVQEDGKPKVLRPARLLRGRMQRPRPNIQKATGREETPTPQGKIGAHVEKNEDESCVDREQSESCVVIPQQMENESLKNLQCEDVTSQPEEKDASANVHSDEPKVLNECPSIQEDSKSNKLKQAPILRTRFQKPKPNTGRKRMTSKERVSEEVPISGETTTLEETAKPDSSPRKKMPIVTITVTPATNELESDLKDTGKNDTSSNMKMSEKTEVTMEMEIGLETIEREISPGEMGAEMIDIPMETEIGLKASLNEISPMENVSELIDTTEEIYTNLEETVRRETFSQENGPKEVSPISEMETDLQETGKDLPTRDRTTDMIDSTEKGEAYSEETERREISVPVEETEEPKTMGEMETHLEEFGGKAVRAPAEQLAREVDVCRSTHEEEAGVESSVVEEKKLDLKGTGERDISTMVMASTEMTATEESIGDLKETGETSISWERGPGEMRAGKHMVADLEETEKDISPREHEPEEHSSRQLVADVIQSSSNDSSPGVSVERKNISNKISVMPTFEEQNENSHKEVLSHVKSSQNSADHETVAAIQPADVLEQFSGTSLSRSLPQEQKPLEVKPAPFLRSRFKKPKPNLSRAALKRATPEAEHRVPGKKSEADTVETVALQQDSEQSDSPSSQHEVPFLMTSRENDNPRQEEEDAVILPSMQTGKDSSLPNSCEPKEDLQSTQKQENGLVVPVGTQKMNMVTQETKQSVGQTTLPVRSRLQRPRPNVHKARQRQITGKGEAEGVAKNEGSELQKDETKKVLTVANALIEGEVEAMSLGVSEYTVNESHRHVVPVDEQKRHENEPHVPSPAQLLRRRFQKAKPNLGGAHHRKEQPVVEKGTTDQSTDPKPEDHEPQKGDLDIQLPLKEKTEILTPLEVSAGKDCIVPEASGSLTNDAQLTAVPSGGARDEIVEDHPTSSLGLEEQGLSKQISSPQLLKESNCSKTAAHRRTPLSSASECETDHSGKRAHRKMKSNVTKGRGPKRIRGKTAKKEPRASKSMLVTLRASQKEDEEDAEDFDSDFEEETYHLAPEELNKAPVFVPVGLRSPEPVSAQIEETMEELEITMDVADIGCVTVLEHQLSNTDATTEDVQPEEDLHSPAFEMVIGEQTPEEPGPSDGSAEAAITLLTMGDIVLQSEIITEQGDVGVCVFPDVHSKDKSHVPFSPDNVNHKIVHEYQEVSSPVISMSPASFEENKIVSKEPSTREEADVMGEIMENTLSTRSTAPAVTKHVGMESHFITGEPSPEKISGVYGLEDHQEVASFYVTKGTEVEIQREPEENDSKAVELEDKSLEPAEMKEQNQLPCVHDVAVTSVSQEALPSASFRSEDQEENLEEVQMLGTAVASSAIGIHTLDSGQGLGESPPEEPITENSKGSSMLMLPVPESVPSNILEVQQENMINPQDVTVNLFANPEQDGEDEQAFILTLVEIPTNTTEGFTDASMQLMPSSLLPAPILVKSGNTVERGDHSESLQTTSVVPDAICLSPSGSDDSEKPPLKVDLISRKRIHCSTDENILVPPAKKSSVSPGVDCQECASEVCSKEFNVFEKTEESCMGQGIFPTSESTHTAPKPQKEYSEPTSQNVGSRSPDEIKDACVEKTMTQLPQDEMVSDKEEKTGPVSSSEQRDSMMSSSKPPLIRPGRRPLGFLSLICPKNSLDSDEATQTHSKKRLKPHIPASRRNLKKPNLLNTSQKKSEESSSDPPPSPSITDPQSDDTGKSAAQVSSDKPSLKEKCKSGPKQACEEEATTVSEFVFNDIFIEVDETE